LKIKIQKILTLNNRVNIPALISGVIVLFYTMLLQEPWWIVKSEDNYTLIISYAPYKICCLILGRPVYIPIADYLSISGLLVFTLISILLIIGALIQNKNLAEILIGYRCFLIITLVPIILYTSLLCISIFAQISLPLVGSREVNWTIFLDNKPIKVTLLVSSEFTYVFYIMIICAILSLIGKLALRIT